MGGGSISKEHEGCALFNRKDEQYYTAEQQEWKVAGAAAAVKRKGRSSFQQQGQNW